MKARIEKIEDFLNTLNVENVDIVYCVNAEEVNSYDDIYEAIENNNGFDVEIVYYVSAINYLKENDPSLRESLGIANDFGFELKNLSSEVLASLLASETARNDFSELKEEIDQFFDELEEDEDEN